jgi:low affinity Fe/Cu permease
MGTSVELDASDSPPACRSANGGGLSATATTVLTFLAVFLIENTQNRDGLAIQLKLDELIRSGSRTQPPRKSRGLHDEELEALHAEFQRPQARERRQATGTVEPARDEDVSSATHTR